LCDNALLNGYALDHKRVDERSVKEVAQDLSIRKKSLRIWVLALICISIAAAILLFIYLGKSGYLSPLMKIFSDALDTFKKG
jgi:hypothetical protein